jgi:uncharacterized protein
MKILFIQGGGEGGYEADGALVTSLQASLGNTYTVDYPRMPADETLSDFGWLQQIGIEINSCKEEIILVGHSLGASMILKYLSEKSVQQKIMGIFLIATPHWSGDDDWVQGLKLKEDFAYKLPKHIPIFLYHCRDDEEVPFEQLTFYKQKLPQAVIREIESGGHQLNNDLSIVAKDIKSL